jgi:alpha-N-arabinofuranosidase
MAALGQSGRVPPMVRLAVALLLLGFVGHPTAQQRPRPSAVPTLTASVRIDATRVANRLNPQLYGHFIEYMFEGIKFGLHAELLENRGFEEAANAGGLPRDWEREPNDRNDDRETTFARDAEVAYTAQPTPFPADASAHSLRLAIKARYDGPRGVRQSRIPVRAHVTYHGSLWLKTADYDGAVTLTLGQDREGGRVYASAAVARVATDDAWHQYTFTLAPTAADPLAKLAILFDGKGRLWLDQVSLMPGDAVDGVRADVFERITPLRPAFVRWPGGNVAQDYHWQWGIGPRDRRPFWINKAWWSEREPGDFGSDEFIAFCRNVKAEPHVVVNVDGAGATPEEAAAWVEYMNGPATSKYGAMRAANGHREPFGVKTWELGNEIWGDWVRGHSDAATYARNYVRYRDAMRAVDPTLRFIAVGRDRTDWNAQVLKVAGRDIELLSIHHYDGPSEQQDARWLLARPLHWEAYYRELAGLIRATAPGRDIPGRDIPGRDIKVIVNEWNSVLPLPRQHSMEAALYAARMLNVFERSGDLVTMTAVSDLVNGWPGGIIQAGRHGVYVTPTYRAIQLFATHLGAERLEAAVESPTFDVPDGPQAVPVVDVTASRSADGRRYILKAVNTSLDAGLRLRVRIDGGQPATRGTLHLLTAPTLQTANSFATPDAVAVRTTQVPAGRAFTLDLPRHSVAVLVLGGPGR